jgi:hypothetical protein
MRAKTTELWDKFIQALATNNTNFDEVKGETTDEGIKNLIKACGIVDTFEVAKILTEFKNRQGNSLIQLQLLSPSHGII